MAVQKEKRLGLLAKMILDAENMVLGRISAFAAKKALLGEDVKIVNCEKAVITGSKQQIIKSYLDRLELGQPQKGPFIQRRPDFFVRRTIRGMISRHSPRGREAFSRVKCFIGPSVEGKAETLDAARISKLKKSSYMTVGELCMHIGYKK